MNSEKIILLTFIGTCLVRAGSILLIVFGLRILISFYKYNVRMAAFADSLQQSISLVGVEDVAKLKDLAEIMNPNKIDFDKDPSLLPEDILNLVKELNKLKDSK